MTKYRRWLSQRIVQSDSIVFVSNYCTLNYAVIYSDNHSTIIIDYMNTTTGDKYRVIFDTFNLAKDDWNSSWSHYFEQWLLLSPGDNAEEKKKKQLSFSLVYFKLAHSVLQIIKH